MMAMMGSATTSKIATIETTIATQALQQMILFAATAVLAVMMDSATTDGVKVVNRNPAISVLAGTIRRDQLGLSCIVIAPVQFYLSER